MKATPPPPYSKGAVIIFPVNGETLSAPLLQKVSFTCRTLQVRRVKKLITLRLLSSTRTADALYGSKLPYCQQVPLLRTVTQDRWDGTEFWQAVFATTDRAMDRYIMGQLIRWRSFEASWDSLSRPHFVSKSHEIVFLQFHICSSSTSASPVQNFRTPYTPTPWVR